MKVYNVYEIYPSGSCYSGKALVGAESVEQANEFILKFKKEDPLNRYDSWGYGYVDDELPLRHLFSDTLGIINYGIYYNG